MSILRLTEEEKRNILNQHNVLKVTKEQTDKSLYANDIIDDTTEPVEKKPFDDTPAAMPAAPTNRVDIIKAIQQKLKDHYKMNLGTSGQNKDGVDGDYGPATASAIIKALQTKPSQRTGGAEVTTPKVSDIVPPKSAPIPSAPTTIPQPVKR